MVRRRYAGSGPAGYGEVRLSSTVRIGMAKPGKVLFGEVWFSGARLNSMVGCGKAGWGEAGYGEVRFSVVRHSS